MPTIPSGCLKATNFYLFIFDINLGNGIKVESVWSAKSQNTPIRPYCYYHYELDE